MELDNHLMVIVRMSLFRITTVTDSRLVMLLEKCRNLLHSSFIANAIVEINAIEEINVILISLLLIQLPFKHHEPKSEY